MTSEDAPGYGSTVPRISGDDPELWRELRVMDHLFPALAGMTRSGGVAGRRKPAPRTSGATRTLCRARENAPDPIAGAGGLSVSSINKGPYRAPP